jgi:glutathione peroxidase
MARAEDEKSETATVPEALAFEVKSIDGEPVNLADYQGKVLLVVNVASKCGLTKQYDGLQGLYEKYQEQGLVVMGFPCNQFLGQEPESEEKIKEFCTTKFNVTFPMFSKLEVNGEAADPLYKYLTALETEPTGAGEISWNFEKFLIGRDGKVIARFEPRTTPESKELVAMVEKALAEEVKE